MYILNKLNEDILMVDFVKMPLNNSLEGNLQYVEGSTNSHLLSQCLGLTQTRLTCVSCRHQSLIYEPFSILSLSLKESEQTEVKTEEVSTINLMIFRPESIEDMEYLEVRVTMSELVNTVDKIMN